MANKTITAPKGFLAAGAAGGVKKSGNLDLGLIVCPTGAKAAAVFTTNKIVSASVTVCKQHVKSAKACAVVVNSGNANACTGQKGIKDAISMCKEVAARVSVSPNRVLIASTGIIGEKLPMAKVKAGIAKASGKLSASAGAGLGFARAIMTTDTKAKQAVRKIKISGKGVTITGTAKGAGMIGPNMATTICVITTDIAISKPLLSKALKAAIGQSLNKLTVDGHQSTNDTAIILASGSANNAPVVAQCLRFGKFAGALADLCGDLARQMALDAEGATRMFKVAVKGATSRADASKAARAVADYDLVKCAVHGADPNWGRIICAVGSCGVNLNPVKLSCKIGDISVFRAGGPVKFDAKKVSKIIRAKEHAITIDLGVGKYSDFCYGCDLSKGYITINADYHT
jgi:glutamate N-acetyltransferase / amino-acid N-acetyltransferase